MVRGRKREDPLMSSDWAISGHVEDWAELAVDFLDDHLDAATKDAVQAHIDQCPECADRLAAQREVVSLFADDVLAEVPVELESLVLERVLAAQTPGRVSRLFHRRSAGTSPSARRRAILSPAGPWLPALAGAAAVAVLVLALTIPDRANELDDTSDTVVSMAATEEGSARMTTDSEAQPPSTTSQALLGLGETATDSGDTDAATGATETAASLASLQPAGPYMQEESTMTDGLAQASSPAYFFFGTPEDSLVTQVQADAIASALTSATGLRLVDSTQSSGVRTFAAFVPRDDSAAVVRLLCSIGDSHKLPVCLSLSPGSEVMTVVQSMLKDKYALAELSAYPATPSGWRYTTSTAPPTTAGTAVTEKAASLDEMGTHVLVVIFMAVQD